MNDDSGQQWARREGYGGPGSFPKEVMGYQRQRSLALGGLTHSLYLSDGRVLDYQFLDGERLNMKCVEGGRGFDAENVSYRAFEGAPGIFIVSHRYPGNERLASSVVLDLNRMQTVVVDGELPADGDSDYRVRETRDGGVIGKPVTSGEIIPPPFPTDIVGRRFHVNYNDIYTYETAFLTRTHLAWHCIKGNTGLVDVEGYSLSQLTDDVLCLSWSEEAECLQAIMLMNFSTGEINGAMFGFDPENREILDFALGSQLVDSAEYGVNVRGFTDLPKEKVLIKNKDVVLRSHHEVWNRAKYDLMDEIYCDEFAWHFICGIEGQGREQMKEFIKGHRHSFPNWTERVVDIVAEGDRIVTRYQSTGTHEGDFMGIAATGKKISVNEVSIYRMKNGQIAEQWGFPDGLSVVQQLNNVA